MIDRAAWLEPHDLFEGVGAHELNPRYDHVDGGGFDDTITAGDVPPLVAARTLLAETLTTIPIRLDGIDVSHFQTSINWRTVAAIPTFWGGLKATQSIGYADPTFAMNRTMMSAVNLRHIGPYHWLSSTTDPHAQAAWFLSTIGTLRTGEFAMIDAEESGVTVASTIAFAETVEAVTRRPSAVYTGAYVAGIWTDPQIRTSKYGPRPMILAAYTTEARARALPGVAANPWSSWQFSSSGPVAGVAGRCDMNRVDDIGVYDRACGRDRVAPPPTAPTPTPQPTPPTVTDEEDQDMDVVTNSEEFYDNAPGHIKFQLRRVNGKLTLTHLVPAEWNAAGQPAGIAISNADIGALGVTAP